ncbi:MAG: ISAzo13 family transposase [Deltaproteobacteria bacterium]|jgi:hypothetical protein|nr:ISAzo13 family transposase [Deltaproteobacteria bacterium]
MTETENALSRMFMNVWPHLGERERRLVAAGEAKRIGRRGISMVSRACGLSRVTITKGIKELDEAPLEPGKTRRAGAGRPRVERSDPGIWQSLEELMQETVRGEEDPPLVWTCKSTRCLAQELTASHHRISHEKVAQILRKNGYNLMGTRKTEEGSIHPDRDDQFRHIAGRASFCLANSLPVLAVETRRRDAPQDQADAQTARAAREPASARDQLDSGAHPRGVYDPRLARESASIRTARETAAFTCDSLCGWWLVEGRELFPEATSILITADNAGGLRRHALWKAGLQKLATASGLPVEFCRYPPGTSRWNGNSQRLFSFVSTSFAGEPRRDSEITVRLVSRGAQVRTMALGLTLDHSRFPPPSGDGEGADVTVYPSDFHGEWNYTIVPEPEAADPSAPPVPVVTRAS